MPSLQTDAQMIREYCKKHEGLLAHNKVLFDIYEGKLLYYLEKELAKQFSAQAFEQIKFRIAPINILRRIVDKLSKIYQETPIRYVKDGNDLDSELLTYFETAFKIDQRMNIGNEFFNLFKNTLVQPLVNEKTQKPLLRIIPSDRFLVFSNDIIEPTKPTHVITYEGKMKLSDGKETEIFFLYSAEEFLAIDSEGQIRPEVMAKYGNPSGENPYHALPFVYVNRSQNLLIPLPDSDTLQMSKLLPIILSDLNYAVMYQAFSVIYAIDCDTQNLTMAPNTLWTIHSVGDGEKKPQLGSIKPQVDIDQVLGLISTQLAFWLNSRGIRPGSVGTLTQDNFASGISKMVDEMDTAEERKKQIEIFVDAEADFWDLVLKKMYPVWVSRGLIEARHNFTETATVVTEFREPMPMIDRGQLIADLKAEMESGFTTRKMAVKKLNPQMSDQDIDAFLAEIDAERAMPAEETAPPEKEELSMIPEETVEGGE